MSAPAGSGPALAPPPYDRTRLTTGIVHIGVGAFHRSHQAMYVDRLLALGATEWGISGVGLLPGDASTAAALRRQDHLYTLALKDPDGTVAGRRIGALREHLLSAEGSEAVLLRLTDPAVRIVTLTITEGGYNLDEATGEFDGTREDVRAELTREGEPQSVFGYVVEALRRRRAAGTEPFTVASCDNIEHNGEVARSAFAGFADLVDPAFGEWLRREVAFPNAMVDRITPATTDDDRALVRERWGVVDDVPVVAEPHAQWVLEDVFPAGRPPLQDVGVQLVADVLPYEQLKLRLLNGGHQALAYAGLLLGHTYVAEAVSDPLVRGLLQAYLSEAAATLPAVPGVDVPAYCSSLVERFGNPHISDRLQRLAEFSSDRMPRFVLPVARHLLGAGRSADATVLVVAMWATYLERVAAGSGDLPFRDRRSRIAGGIGLLGERELLGVLADDERFAAALRAAVQRIQRDGAADALAGPARGPGAGGGGQAP